MEIIKVENLTFRYEDSAKKVLEQFHLTIEKGSFTALLGHNGSGKSSLAKLFNGILLPEGGSVYVSGMDTKNEEMLLEIRKNCGLVFQNPDNQLVASIIEDDVAFAPENLGVPSGEIRERVDDALKCVGMYEYRLRSPHHLSGGQKQRVAIAGIVAMRPSVIVLDEPTAMLDPKGRKEVVETILRLNRDYGITAILITHNMEEAALADRVVVMEKGKILLDGTPKEIFSQYEILKQTGLDVPQITELSYKLHQAGFPVESCILSADELVEQILRVL